MQYTSPTIVFRAALAMLVTVVAGSATSHPTNIGELFTTMADKAEAATLAVISEGNWDTVSHLLPDSVVPVIIADKSELEESVRNGSVDAGLMSGIPANTTGLATFSSTAVSPRAMFSRRGGDPMDAAIRDALDAAIATALKNGAATKAARENPPYEFVAVHTCKTTDLTQFPWPEALTNPNDPDYNASRTTIRIASLGPFDWGQDGNYKANPPTGFWPDFERAVEAVVLAETGLKFDRVWADTSTATMALVESGEADATAPYWTVDSFYEGRARQQQFEMGCSTIGLDSTFLVRAVEPETAAAGDEDEGFPVGGGIALAVLAVIGIAVIVFLVNRERGGKPVFQPLLAKNQQFGSEVQARDTNAPAYPMALV